MELQTILELREKINGLYELLEVMELDYLYLLDDDLWTVDLETKPYFTREYDVKMVTDLRLTKKYVIRFCEDYGLNLKSYKETDKGYEYIFEAVKNKEYNKNINLIED